MTDHIHLAKLAEQAERYEDMKQNMVDFVRNKIKEKDPELTTEQRNLLSVAFKNVVGHKRTALKVLSSIAEKGEGEKKQQFAREYQGRVNKELQEQCDEVIKLLDDLIPSEKDNEQKETKESRVFYYKMKGDYLRYLAEANSALGKEVTGDTNPGTQANEAYKKALDHASSDLASTHPIRLGLVLNYSVFFYEIQNEPEKACKLAKEAFDDAISELDSVPEESYKDSTLIMQLLRDNLTLWTNDEQQQEEN